MMKDANGGTRQEDGVDGRWLSRVAGSAKNTKTHTPGGRLRKMARRLSIHQTMGEGGGR